MTQFESVILPGQEGMLKVTFKVGDARGPVQKTIHVSCNDPEQPEFTLQVTVFVESALAVRPGPNLALVTSEGVPASKDVSIVSEDGTPFRILSVQSSNPAVRAEVLGGQGTGKERTEQAALEHELRLTVSGQKPGQVSADVTVHVDHPKLKQVLLQVGAEVKKAITVSPERLQIHAFPSPRYCRVIQETVDIHTAAACESPAVGRAVKEQELRVLGEKGSWIEVSTSAGVKGWVQANCVAMKETESRSPSAEITVEKHGAGGGEGSAGFKILDTSTDVKGLVLEFQPLRDGEAYRIKATYREAVREGIFKGTITIRTNDREAPILTVPVRIIVQGD